MMKPSQHRQGDDFTLTFNRANLWRAFFERQVRAMRVVVGRISRKRAAQMVLVHDDDMIEAFARRKSGDTS
jgi:hypothetical protein